VLASERHEMDGVTVRLCVAVVGRWEKYEGGQDVAGRSEDDVV